MKKIIIFIGIGIVAYGMAYLMAAFVCANLNFLHWQPFERLCVMAFSFCTHIFTFYIIEVK